MSKEIGSRDLWQKLHAKNRTRKRAMLARSEAELSNAKKRNDILPNLVLGEIALGDICKNGRTIRKLEPSHIRETMSSIQVLGFCSPILIGKDNSLIDGAIRVEACRRLGIESVPCIRMDHLSK